MRDDGGKRRRMLYAVGDIHGENEKLGELIVEYLDDLFAGFDGLEDVLAHGLFFDLSDEVLGYAKFNVGLKQGESDFTESIGNVFLGNFSYAA